MILSAPPSDADAADGDDSGLTNVAVDRPGFKALGKGSYYVHLATVRAQALLSEQENADAPVDEEPAVPVAAVKAKRISGKRAGAADRRGRAKAMYKEGQDLMASNPRQARTKFEATVKLSGGHRGAWLGIHRMSVRLGDDKRAATSCKRVVKLGRDREDAYTRTCQSWLRRNGL